ncbi:hypothetical protein TNCV_852361 [Trichonephila clavipes]|nr:hypothetical protein TNCV_852361 [Trichonephila clavipes]
MTNIELRNIIIGSKDYEEEFVRDQLSVILEERFERKRSKVFGRMSSGRVVQKIVRRHLQITELVSGGPRNMRETSPAVLMAEATIPVTTPIKEEKEWTI